jgi:predicted dithiol-disulfide oxidoreductase (DUF899 family)
MSDEYRAARDALLDEKIALRRHAEAVAERRRRLPLGGELFFAPADPGLRPRHVDFIWPVWAVLDHTPEGRGTDWGPELADR